MVRLLLIALMLLSFPYAGRGQSREAVETSTDIAMFAPAAVGVGVALFEGDYKGLLQLGEALATSVAVSYALKYTVKKERPDGSDFHSFPLPC